MGLADTIGTAVTSFTHYAPGASALQQIVGDLEVPCDYGERKWGFSHGAAKWVGFVRACPTCHSSGQRLFCEGCFSVFSTDDNCFTCDCGEVTAPARHAFSRLEHLDKRPEGR